MKSLICAISALFLATTAFAAPRAGNIATVEGRVEILHDDAVIGSRARPGAEVVVHDLVRTKHRSQAEVHLIDGSKVTVYERSRMKIYGIEEAKLSEDGDYSAEIQKGRVLFDIAKIKRVSGEFRIKTTTSVIGVKGTKFSVDVLPEVTRVNVFEGLVDVYQINRPDVRMDVRPGRTAIIRSGGEVKVIETPEGFDSLDQSVDIEVATGDGGATTDAQPITETASTEEATEELAATADDTYTQPDTIVDPTGGTPGGTGGTTTGSGDVSIGFNF